MPTSLIPWQLLTVTDPIAVKTVIRRDLVSLSSPLSKQHTSIDSFSGVKYAVSELQPCSSPSIVTPTSTLPIRDATGITILYMVEVGVVWVWLGCGLKVTWASHGFCQGHLHSYWQLRQSQAVTLVATLSTALSTAHTLYRSGRSLFSVEQWHSWN